MFRYILIVCPVFFLLALTQPAAADEKDEMTKLAGSWESGDVKDADGQGTGVIKITLTDDGHADLEIAAKRAGHSSSSKRSFTYHIQEKDGEKFISSPGARGTGLLLSYHIDGDQLILSGTVASRRVAYELQNVALKHPAK